MRESQAIRIVEPLPETPAWLDATLAVREQGGGVVLEVQDRGSGLGLTLCREIVEAHGGRLSIANHHGGGAVVTAWLPQARLAPDPESVEIPDRGP